MGAVTDDSGNALVYNFVVDSINGDTATITFTKTIYQILISNKKPRAISVFLLKEKRTCLSVFMLHFSILECT